MISYRGIISRCSSHRPKPREYIGCTAGPPFQNVHAGYIMSKFSLTCKNIIVVLHQN